mgnify:CR=1 FL=1
MNYKFIATFYVKLLEMCFIFIIFATKFCSTPIVMGKQ